MLLVKVSLHLQDQLLPLLLAQLHPFRCFQVHIQGGVGPTRGADGDLGKYDFADRPRVHGGDDGSGGPGVKGLVDQADSDAEAGDDDENPDDSCVDAFSCRDVRQTVDRR